MPTQTEMGLGYPGSTKRVSSLKRQYLGEGGGEQVRSTGGSAACHAHPCQGQQSRECPRATHLSPRKKKVWPVGSHQIAVSMLL